MSTPPAARRLLVVMDPIAGIKPKKDTTLALMLAAQEAGWTLHCADTGALRVHGAEPRIDAAPVTVRDDERDWFTLAPTEDLALADFPLILMRKDPPFDQEYIYATYWLERAQAAGSRVVNAPRSLRDCNEKGFITWFPNLIAPTLIARDPEALRAFHAEHGEIVLKPLDGMGGHGVFVIGADGRNLNAVIDALGDGGRRTIMAQRYLPAIASGDKRILMIDGEPIDHVLARIPAEGETRGNLAAGGRGVVQPLSATDRRIAEAVGPELRARGIVFAGLDVIGEALTEINITSPTCLREIQRETGQDIAARAIAAMTDGL
ncbi:glutathione synthase [Algiphilus sp.]|uniref:glutathione synthase n=1 Tax=Algiphilus sp. TaxID=1872431 RepID=UPI0025BC6075|nr:glutathione synthase [Algiphilus sp.]